MTTPAAPGTILCPKCGGLTDYEHDHRDDLSGLDDGPPLPSRKKPPAKGVEEMTQIRAKAWLTRRAKYGQRGHR